MLYVHFHVVPNCAGEVNRPVNLSASIFLVRAGWWSGMVGNRQEQQVDFELPFDRYVWDQ